MLVKENSSTKIIEDKMGFKFKDLDPIGYLTKFSNGYLEIKIALYKNKDSIFEFEFKVDNLKQIHSIIKIDSIDLRRGAGKISFIFNNKKYYCTTSDVLSISAYENSYKYKLIDTQSSIEFLNENKLMITDEEFVMLKLLNNFLNEEELLSKYDI
ncbi:MAG: hypothetical protein SOZ53_01380 [Candidatus Onthovivens sp.]|nr:hypothetical protein [Candidatus Onthovivens sp.]